MIGVVLVMTKKLSTESKADILKVYQELFCSPTTITSEGVAVAENLKSYILSE
tara:strand:+ start:1126 stop:1284 length:159 start_codon:yes stop_codon:yes gene_type:complete